MISFGERKPLAKLLSVWCALCVALTGCSQVVKDSPEKLSDQSASEENTSDPSEQKKETVLQLCFDSSDSFHPFAAETQTQYELFALLYDGLIKVSPEYEVEYKIASKVVISGTTCQITLSGQSFSDGSKITPQDVVYSFEKAAASSLYGAQLSDMESCEASANGVTVTLKRANRYFVYDLDFPIIKEASANADIPIGCGRYALQKNGNTYRMEQNPQYGSAVALPAIELTALQGNDSRLYAVKTGAITAYLEDSSEEVGATVGTWTASVSLNHLVFVGINPENPLFADALVRKAMYAAIDSNTILSQAYGSQGVIALAPVNPWFTNAMDYDFSAHGAYNAEQAKKLLEQAGFTLSDTSCRVNGAGKELKVTILVNKNNSARYSAAYLISGMLEAVGFSVTLEQVGYSEYLERIKAGEFDLYIGETAQTLDCSNEVFLSGDASYGIGEESDFGFAEAVSAFFASEQGEKAYLDFIFEQVPMIPILYRNGLMIYSKQVENQVITAPHDIFYNIEEWF